MVKITSEEFVNRCKNAVLNYKTLYVMGCFGWPLTQEMKERAKREHAYNKKPDRSIMIDKADAKTFGFDCVCFIKAILWGWNGDYNKKYGGAEYESNGIDDITITEMLANCTELSTDFNNIQSGEIVWLPGHVGVYVGKGLVIECSPSWENGLQVTSITEKPGYHCRRWLKHGKLSFIEYLQTPDEKLEENVDNLINIDVIARKVINGDFGNGSTRKKNLGDYFYRIVQNRVNELCK